MDGLVGMNSAGNSSDGPAPLVGLSPLEEREKWLSASGVDRKMPGTRMCAVCARESCNGQLSSRVFCILPSDVLWEQKYIPASTSLRLISGWHHNVLYLPARIEASSAPYITITEE
jgi:hypothetical protein